MIDTKGWPLFGKDGKPSARQWLGTASFCFAAGYGFAGLKAAPVSWENFIPMAIAAVVGLFLFGFVTAQNVKEIVSASRGNG